MNPPVPPAPPAVPRGGGFTLIELILVVALVSGLALVGIERLLYYQELAEKATMEANLAAFRMGLQIRSAELTIANRQTAMAALERENPVRWLDAPPPGYAGEYRAPVEAGRWYFDPATAELVYVPASTLHLTTPGEGRPELRFRIRVRYDDIDAADGRHRVVSGISVLPVGEYRWF